jgi:hypothetical protein
VGLGSAQLISWVDALGNGTNKFSWWQRMWEKAVGGGHVIACWFGNRARGWWQR